MESGSKGAGNVKFNIKAIVDSGSTGTAFFGKQRVGDPPLHCRVGGIFQIDESQSLVGNVFDSRRRKPDFHLVQFLFGGNGKNDTAFLTFCTLQKYIFDFNFFFRDPGTADLPVSRSGKPGELRGFCEDFSPFRRRVFFDRQRSKGNVINKDPLFSGDPDGHLQFFTSRLRINCQPGSAPAAGGGICTEKGKRFQPFSIGIQLNDTAADIVFSFGGGNKIVERKPHAAADSGSGNNVIYVVTCLRICTIEFKGILAGTGL